MNLPRAPSGSPRNTGIPNLDEFQEAGTARLRSTGDPGIWACDGHIRPWRRPCVRVYDFARNARGAGETRPVRDRRKTQWVKTFQDLTAAIDASGMCLFTSFALDAQDYADLLTATTGMTIDTAELLRIGEPDLEPPETLQYQARVRQEGRHPAGPSPERAASGGGTRGAGLETGRDARRILHAPGLG